MLLSSLYVRFRDVSPIWTVASTLLFYGTPVLYAVESVKDSTFEHLLMFNPIACILEQARRWVIDGHAHGAIEATGGPLLFLVPVAIFVSICALGLWVFDREAPRIAERL
jgi:ABC-2 type transport system permease protein